MYHSLRSRADNKEILRLLDKDPECQVIIAMIAFANGLNVKSLLDSISLGFQLWQEKGPRRLLVESSFSSLVFLPPRRNSLRVGRYFIFSFTT
jgi:hypothetical protein